MSEWISVDYRLPDTAEENGNWSFVNVYCEDGYVRLYGYHIKSGVWYEGLDKALHAATHWMPLPEPPKGE